MARYTVHIHTELVRCCANYDPEALGYWGLFGNGDVVEVELLDGSKAKVKGPETVTALKALPAGSSVEQVKATLLSQRIPNEEG